MESLLPFIGTWSPWTILSFVVLAIVRGWLVPRSVLEDRLKDAYAQRDIWKEVADGKQQLLDRKDGIIPAQVETAKTLEHLISSIRENVKPPEDKT